MVTQLTGGRDLVVFCGGGEGSNSEGEGQRVKILRRRKSGSLVERRKEKERCRERRCRDIRSMEQGGVKEMV